MLFRYLGLMALALCLPVSAQQRTVAITVDDLPFATGKDRNLTASDIALAKSVNRKLLTAFKSHHVPVTGFVIEQSVQKLGAANGAEILSRWTAEGFDLGNHTYSHPDINLLLVREIEDEIVRGETTFGPLMKKEGKKPKFFRFPMSHTGDNKEKHDAIAAFLAQQGYEVATCTIDNSDYLFNVAYVRSLERNEKETARKLRLQYLEYTGLEIDYYASLNRQVLGYEPPQVMVLHDNRLNADVINGLLKLFEGRKYRFVSLRTAQSDPAYHIPDTFITQYGPMWGYRWARERGVRVNGKLEAEPPRWVLDYGRTD